MNLRDLREQIAGLSRMHDLTPVNVSGLTALAGAVVFQFDASEAEEERDSLKEDVERLTKEADEARAAAEIVDEELATCQALLSEIKDDGGTLLAYRERMEQAELQCRGWHDEYKRMDREITALRKRKGVGAALVANAKDVVALLRILSTGGTFAPEKATELYRRIVA